MSAHLTEATDEIENSEFEKEGWQLPEAKEGVHALLALLGRDSLTDEAVKETPARFVKAMREIAEPDTSTSPAEILSKQFDSDSTAPVFVGPVSFTSLCEHHLLPFTGRAWLAYQPDGSKVVGLSKLGRLVRYYAKRPQIQEGLTSNLLDALMEHAPAQGAFVYIEGEHTCMSLRGIKVEGSRMITVQGAGTMEPGSALYSDMLSLTR